MWLIGEVKEFAIRWKPLVGSLAIGLILAGVTATTSMLWTMKAQITHQADKQKFQSQSTKTRTGNVNQALNRIWSKQQGLNKRITDNRDGIEANSSRIQVLRSQVKTLQHYQHNGTQSSKH